MWVLVSSYLLACQLPRDGNVSLALHRKRHITKRTRSSQHRRYDRSRASTPAPSGPGKRASPWGGSLVRRGGGQPPGRRGKRKQGGEQETEEKGQREKEGMGKRRRRKRSSSNQRQRRRETGLAPGNCFKILLMWTSF